MATSTIKFKKTAWAASWVYLDDDVAHKVSVPAFSYRDFMVDVVAKGSPVLPGEFFGHAVLCDRNANIIVTIVSQSGNTLTFRCSNPTNTAQTTGGIVAIFRFLG